MKKKILLSLLCGVMVLGVATGCGNKENNNGDNNSTNNPTVENNKNESTTTGEITIDSVKNAKVTDVSKFEYEEVEGGISITGYNGDDKIVVIPDTIEGKKVIEIGRAAFANNENIEGLKIGNNIQKIGESAFANCNGLSIAIFGQSVKTVDRVAFNRCTNLMTVELNEGLETLGNGCFAFSKIAELEIPDSVTTVDYIFTKDENITRTIVASNGSAAEEYVNKCAEVYNLKFQAK